MLLLFKATTGESWNYIMTDSYLQYGPIAIIYWVLFIIIIQFVFINIFVAVVYEAFFDIKSSEDINEVLSLKRKDIKNFINTWAKFNPNGGLYIKTKEFPDFL